MKRCKINNILDTIGFAKKEYETEKNIIITIYRTLLYNNHVYTIYFFSKRMNYAHPTNIILRKQNVFENCITAEDLKGVILFTYSIDEYNNVYEELKKEFIHILRKKKINSIL